MDEAALQFVCQKGIVNKLFPISVTSDILSSFCARKFDWINTDITNNKLQVQAVRHIVEGTSHPAPYILFGPPGTGKTKTLVEAISQIYITDKNSRILVCATSNAAADELASRLIQNLSSGCWFGHHVYRIYSSSYEPEIQIEQSIRACSNFHLKYIPDLGFLSKFRIIVATLLIGGSLRFADLPESYFTHLFIDECGSATEISTLVPIACAPHAKIVLSGDPKQLGPVITSKHASNLGFGISLLERLIKSNVYRKDPESSQHNPNVLTKLRLNYRSHPAIIYPSNRLFYDGDLQAMADKKNTHCFLNWKELPSSGTPIIFHACTTQSQREANSTSLFNMDEVFILINYVKLIMQERINENQVQEEDIGIISPYKKQCHKIKEQLKMVALEHIMVATVEMFQGQEKPIMLVSTARSKMGGIGFLRSPQRLNVLLTRAKCLMIIIGDPNTLKLDKNWRQVLMRFKKTGVCTGETFDFKWQAIESSGSKEINDKNPKSTFTVDLQIKQESKYNRIHDSITMYKSASTSATQQAGSTTRSSTTASSSSSSNMLPLKNHKSVAITSDSSIKPLSSTIRTALRTTVPTSTASTPTLTRNAPSINKVDFTYSGKNVSSVRTLPTNSLASNWAASTSAWVDNEIRYVRNAQNANTIYYSHRFKSYSANT